MSGRTRASASLLRRTIHVGHDPMVRRSDRIEGCMFFGLIIFAVLLVPLAVWAGAATSASQNALITHQAVHTHSVSATTTGDSVASTVIASEYVMTSTEFAPAKWAWHGQNRSGEVAVDPDADAGTRVDIYVDDNGDQTAAPISESGARVASIVAGVFAWVGTMMMLTICFMLVRVWLDHSRAVQWDRDLRVFLDANSL